MNSQARLCKALFCGLLAFASFGGAWMRPEEIEELMYTMNRPAITHTLPENTGTGDLLQELLGTGGPADP